MSLPADIEIAVFDAARQMEDAAVRDAFLEWAFRDAPGDGALMKDLLASENDALVWFHEASSTRVRLAGEILETGSLDLSQADFDSIEALGLNDLISGRFKILQRLGEGGGGLVFLAEQSEPVRRKAAIKLLRTGMNTEAFLAAFQRERQALAQMNHPNIAGIIDAGSTETGIPYFVMELVEGERITRFCDTRRDTIHQRIQWFLQVCSAIQHAHQKGLIHRDIKPSNVLVSTADAQPLPKVIDFGIAAVTAKGNPETNAPLAAGTPAYMSPEQAEPQGIDADTRTDVFSLGVLLYELLAGKIPWSPGPMPHSPPAPSEYLASLSQGTLEELASLRQLGPRVFLSALRGDLDAIILKAIATERQQRYATVNSLAMDLRRYLDIQPVIARRHSNRYALEKFIRRNRLVCLSATAILASLSIAAMLAFGSYLRERQARMDAERARSEAASLLQQAEIRETVATAAILLHENRIPEANALLLNTSLSNVEPTLEAANVFRFLGASYALRGQLDKASECFSVLIKVGHLRSAEDVAANLDLLYAGPVFLECGKEHEYQAMRRDMIARLPTTRNPVTAEHMVKICLLLPAGPDLLRSLAPMNELMRTHFPQSGDLWFAMAIALFEYRCGDFGAAGEWAEKCIASHRIPPSRVASGKLISAMALHHQGRKIQARKILAEASRMIEGSTSDKPPKAVTSYNTVQGVESYDLHQGTWYAWSVARVLRREAESLILHP